MDLVDLETELTLRSTTDGSAVTEEADEAKAFGIVDEVFEKRPATPDSESGS